MMYVRILQINRRKERELIEKTQKYYSFISMDTHKQMGTKPEASLYEQIYGLGCDGLSGNKQKLEFLERLFRMFNRDEKPEGYCGHSMSISDVVMLGNEAWYCDEVGFVKLPDFKYEE